MDSFNKQFLHFCRNKSFGSTFSDFLTIVLCSLCLGTEEELYLETIKRYKEEEVKQDIPRLFACLIRYYEENVTSCGQWCDPLGDLFEEYSSLKGRQMSGQFFTPISLCTMSAGLTFNPPYPEGQINISDCAVGSGRMLIASSRVSPEINRRGFFHGTDIDRQCSLMAAINFYFHGLNGVIIHGDSLALKAFGGWLIKPHLLRVQRLTA